MLEENKTQDELITELKELREQISRLTGLENERKQTDVALKESEEKYRLIVETTNQGICIIDAGMVIAFVNKRLAGMLEYSPEELVGRPVWDFMDESGRAISLEKMEKLRQGLSENFEINVTRKDGTPIWMMINAVSRYDKGNFAGSVAMITDITERKLAEKDLRLTQFSIDRVADIALWVAPDGRFIYANEAACKAFGYTREEFLSLKAFDTNPYFNEKNWGEHWNEVKERGSFTFEARLRKKDGAFFPGEITVNYIVYEGKEYNCSFIRDISERKRAEDALRRNEQMLKQSQEIAHLGSWELDLITNTLSWSDEVYRIFGLQPQEFGATYEAFIEAVHPDDRTVVDTAYWGSIHEGRDNYEIEHRILKRSNGDIRIVHEKCEHFRDASGRIIRSLGMIHDITERKRAEEEVRLAYAYNRSLIEASLDPLVTIAPDGKITDVNLATETVTGYPREKLIGTDFSNYFTDPEKAKEGYLKVLQEGSVKDYPLEIRHRNGHITPVIYTAVIYRNDRGEVIGVFAAARDVAERRRVEEALEEAKNQAEIYLDLMGHDINNLNQVGMGYLELALDTLNLDEKGRELLAKPLEALESSSKLIDNVRKIQLVKTGERKLYGIDVARLLRDLIPKYTSINGREVTMNYVSGCHCFVMANDLLADVFSNILGNAVKHSSGPLIINVRVSKAESVDKAYCKVTIEDNGTGIPDNMKKKLFSRFQRGNTKASGKGLGLYLVRSLVHYYHGYVWIEDSVPGDHTKGARFVVMLPVIEDASLYAETT